MTYRLLTTADATDALSCQRITILGYGSQGRAHALNLRDSGLDIRLGLRPGGKSWSKALEDGWQPLPMHRAIEGADLIAMLMPDMAQAAIWEALLEGQLKAGTMLLFAHGFNIHFDRISPPSHLDIALIAPKAPGALVRRQYEIGRGVPCLLAIEQDATGTAHARALAYAHGLGGTRAGVMETTFAEETETDLFGEQAVLCGGVTELITMGWETLVEAGYQPEVAYFECMHELKLIVDLLYEGGLGRMHEFISETASYGDLISGPRILDEHARERMRDVLEDIRNGTFARAWIAEHETGKSQYNARLAADLAHPIETIGAELRSRMSWLSEPQESPRPPAARKTRPAAAIGEAK